MAHRLDYGNMMHHAMRGLIRDVLRIVRDNGLPDPHHFFITFDTTYADVDLSEWLKTRYPEEITIVLQHWFDQLEVTEDGFTVTLNFGDQPERLSVPFDAIRTFVDPSVEFGLKFESQDDDEEGEAGVEEFPAAEMDANAEEPNGEAEVVSLDSFRKH